MSPPDPSVSRPRRILINRVRRARCRAPTPGAAGVWGPPARTAKRARRASSRPHNRGAALACGIAALVTDAIDHAVRIVRDEQRPRSVEGEPCEPAKVGSSLLDQE